MLEGSTQVDQVYNEKFRKVDVQRRVAVSTERNKSRLRLLEAREKVLADIFEKSHQALKQTKRKSAKYHRLLKNLILEALVQMNEPKARIVAKKGDITFAEKQIPAVIDEFIVLTNNKYKKADVHLTLDKDEFLSAQCSGGIILYNEQGNIIINNTLEERLNLLSETALPQIRTALFGASTTRRFFN